jgi:tRNA(Ile)-lysidine synthase
MRALVDRVRRTVRSHGLVEAGGRVVAALSGGSDSVALVLLLRALDEAGDLSLVGVAHLNHRLRAGAAHDERFCRDLAARLALPIEVESVDVAGLAARRGVSIEVAGREARYDFLARAAARLGAERVAVGHTRDDQAETFLLRLFRGAGARGLSAIPPRNGIVVRPLLDIGRAELRAFLAAHRVSYCEDETNANLGNPRNRIRHELLPYLRAHFAPDVTAVLARAAAIARDETGWLDGQAIEIAQKIVLSDGASPQLEVERLRALHPAVARRVVRHALSGRAGGRFVGFDHVEAVLDLARSDSGPRRVDLPGQRAVRAAGRIRLDAPARREGRTAAAPVAERPLPVPGTVELRDLGWELGTEPLAANGVQSIDGLSARGLTAVVDRRALSEPLAVRTRRPGDSLRPLGLGGRKKLQDLLVDHKVPREERDRVPLVVDARGQIVWVVGHTVAQAFRITASSQAVILLKARRLGGQG